MTDVRTTVSDWLIAAAASATIIYAGGIILGVATDSFSEAVSRSAFLVFIGYAGVIMSLASSAYAPELIPIFAGLVTFWLSMLLLMRRRDIRRLVGVAIATTCLLSFWSFGLFGINATQMI